MITEPQENIIDTLQKFVDSRFMDVHTSIPGKVISYDKETHRACVQPLVRIKRKVSNEILTIDIPAIDNVPVMKLSSSKFILEFPIEKDDGVAIFFSEMGIGNFLNGGSSIVDPDDISKFSLTDAFCIPGLWGKNYPSGTPTIELDNTGNLITTISGNSVLAADGDAVADIKGMFSRKNLAADELSLMNDLFGILKAFVVVGSSVTQTTAPPTIAQLVALQAKYALLFK